LHCLHLHVSSYTSNCEGVPEKTGPLTVAPLFSNMALNGILPGPMLSGTSSRLLSN